MWQLHAARRHRRGRDALSRCACALATQWWKPAANPVHDSAFCSQVGRVGPWAGDRPAIEIHSSPTAANAAVAALRHGQALGPQLVYDDGIHYGTGWPVMDQTAFVLESSFDR